MAGAYLGWALGAFGLAALSVVFAVRPRWGWRLSEGWKYDDPVAAEESYLFHRWNSIRSAIVAVLCVGGGIAMLLVGRAQWREEAAEKRCERTMSALLADSREDDASLDQVAAEHGVEFVAPDDRTWSVDVYDDGGRIGSMSLLADDYHCS